MYRFFVLALGLFFVLGCQQEIPSSAEALSADEIAQIAEEFEQASSSMEDLIAKLDAEAEASFQSERFTWVMNARATDKQEVLRQATEAYKNIKSKESLSSEFKTEVLGRNAVMQTGYATTKVVFMAEEEVTMEVGAEVTVIWVKEKGEWKQLRTHVTPIPLQ